MQTKTTILLILILLLVTQMALIFSQDYDDLLMELYEDNLAYKQALYQSMASFISKNPEYSGLDALYFRLAELSAELYVTEPEIILHNYRQVLELNPDYPLKDVVLYNIAYYSADLVKKQRDQKRAQFIQQLISEGRTESLIRWDVEYRLSEESLSESISAYREIILYFPGSRYFSESIYRLSVVYYEIGLDAERPIEYYKRAQELLDFLANQEGDEYQYLGLYQRGWSFFSSNKFIEAIEDFARILNIVDEETVLKAYIEEDALENIAYSLERIDEGNYLAPSKSVDFAQNNLPQLVESDNHIKKIIQYVISLKLDLNAPFHAVDYYEAYLNMYPLSIDNPSIVDTTATIFRVYSFMFPDDDRVRELVVRQKEKLIEDFSASSEWYRYNAQYDISEQLEIIREAYEFMEPRYYNRFVNDKSDQNFAKYSALIDQYALFPGFTDPQGLEWIASKEKNTVDFVIEIAQEREQPHHYLDVYNAIDEFNAKYPANDFYVDYEIRKFLAIERLFDQLYSETYEQPYIDQENDLNLTQDDLKLLFINSTDNFLTFVADSEMIAEYDEDIVRALFKRSQIHLDDGEYTEVEDDLHKILEYNVPPDFLRAAYIKLAQINEKMLNHFQAENYYRSAAAFAFNPDDQVNVRNHYLAQIQANAQTLSSENSDNEAAEEYLRLAEEFRESDPDRFVGFTREAIDSFIRGASYQRAIELLIGLSLQRFRPAEAHYLYASAWNIADTLMSDQQLSQELKREYISKYPASIEAYQTRYELIEDYAGNPETKYLAAEMLLELHTDAVSGNINYGEDNPADIYYDALNLYYDHPDSEFLIPLLQEFTNGYPQDQRSVAIMELLAMKYAALGRDSEFEELARRIYLRDPASQLYENVARNRLLEKYNEITESFVAERFDEMNLRIREFEELDRNYRQNNLRLPLQEFYLDFEDYRYAANRMNEYRVLVADLTRTLNDIDQNFINASPDALIRINALTRWQENLSGGDNRLEGIVDRANSYRDNIVGIIQRVREFEQSLDIELNTRSLFVIAKTYEHTANVIEVQLDKFLNVSNQIVELRRFDESEYQSIARFINDSYKVPYATFLRSESAAWYDLLVVNFVHNLNHNDKYTEAAKNRLQEWGLLKERVSLYSDGDWLVTLANDINDLQILDWSKALVKTDVDRLKEISGMLHTQAQPIALPDEYAINIKEDPVVDGNQREENALFLRKFSLTGEVLDARLSLASYDDSTVWINGRSFVMETDVLYDARDNIFYAHTISIPPDSFTEGENTILITTPDNPQLPLILFNLDLTVRVK